MITADLEGTKPVIELPVTIGEEARRKALIASGVKPDARQVFRVADLLDVPSDELRERVVDLAERVDIRDYDSDPEWVVDTVHSEHVVVLQAYDWLRMGADGWAAWNDDGAAVEINHLYSATPGLTRPLWESMADFSAHGEAAYRAALASHPLVKELEGDQHLTLEKVLDAYDTALEIAAEVVKAAWSAPTPTEDNLWLDGTAWSDELILLVHPREKVPPIGLLREADPKSFEAALAIVREIHEKLAIPAVEYFVYRACERAQSLRLEGPKSVPTDADILRKAIEPAADGARRQQEDTDRERNQKTSYEDARQVWIDELGSNRLRLAAGRGYRHDGLYRDERLAAELPGFTGFLGRRSEVKEIVNPSEEALNLETEVLKQVQRQRLKVKVKLVFVKADYEMRLEKKLAHGEYVEINGYLDRHKVYRPVGEDPDYSDPDDIPF